MRRHLRLIAAAVLLVFGPVGAGWHDLASAAIDCSQSVYPNSLDGRCLNQTYFAGMDFGADISGGGYGSAGVFATAGTANAGNPCTKLSINNPISSTYANNTYLNSSFFMCGLWNYTDTLGSDGLDEWAFPYNIDNGQPNAAQNFINFIGDYLNDTQTGCSTTSQFVQPSYSITSYGSCQYYRARIIGAAFLVLTMVGGQYTTYDVGNLFASQVNGISGPFNNVQAGIQDARNVFNTWSQEVLQADANGQVNWNSDTPASISFSQHPNTSASDYNHDIMMHPQGPQERHSIIFNNPSGQYVINRRCGNTDSFAPLAPVVVASATCAGYITDVTTPDPNQPFNLTVSVQFSPNSAASSAFGPDTMSMTLTGPSPYAGFSKSTTSPTISNGVASMKVTVPATNVAGTFNLAWQTSGSVAPTTSCAGTLKIAYVPYFTIRGGDVSAGQGFGNSCTGNSVADIDGKNLDNGSSPANYFGASTSNAAIATGSINHFASDTINNVPSNLGGSSDGLSADQPSGPLLANNSISTPSYGGGALGSWSGNWCVPDYATNAGTPSGVFNPTNLVSGTYTLSGTSIGGFTVPAGVHITVIATAGAYISGDIKFASYSSLNQIPQFTLLVKGGDIYVDHSVKELHGFYDTQPDSAAVGGHLFTCTTAFGSPSTDYATCNVPLTFYGSVAASQIIPGRTAGNITPGGAVSDNPAEQFVYTPELWLGNVYNPTQSCAQNAAQPVCMYVTYTNLPPTL